MDNGVIMNFNFEKVPLSSGQREFDDWFWLFDSCFGFPDGISITWHALGISLTYGDPDGTFASLERIKMDSAIVYTGNFNIDNQFYM